MSDDRATARTAFSDLLLPQTSHPSDRRVTVVSAVDIEVHADRQMARILADASQARRLVLVVEVPARLSRLSLSRALDEQIGRWGRRRGDVSAFVDLTNHPALPAQSIVESLVQTWDDVADGLPQAIAGANVLVVVGLEQMLKETPHRLAAFLEARARHQVVVVLSAQARRVCDLQIRDTPVHLDRSLVGESDLIVVTRNVSLAVIAAAKCATRRDSLGTSSVAANDKGGTS